MENKKGVSKGLVVSIFIILILVLGIIGGAFYIYCNQPKDIIENTLELNKELKDLYYQIQIEKLKSDFIAKVKDSITMYDVLFYCYVKILF